MVKTVDDILGDVDMLDFHDTIIKDIGDDFSLDLDLTEYMFDCTSQVR